MCVLCIPTLLGSTGHSLLSPSVSTGEKWHVSRCEILIMAILFPDISIISEHICGFETRVIVELTVLPTLLNFSILDVL